MVPIQKLMDSFKIIDKYSSPFIKWDSEEITTDALKLEGRKSEISSPSKMSSVLNSEWSNSIIEDLSP